ncbi:hypothetical protein CC86DRAFT_394848 [Ophiobolus disseminans]|uniref:Uncharacterized protein n=1 Tax=Ophiobolus disseminans TaxID=1469910 RepID=A0A6A6ZWK7_9PLEO|nr:hypothetical protein CC86DRAFT_394848 [Ophiobolus disseminans]
MRSFQQIVVFLFALLVCALAQSDTDIYDSTVYITSTVYRVNTVTMSGASPSGTVANHTSTIHPSQSLRASVTSFKGNGTAVLPTGSGAKPSPTQFTGAASSLNINAYVAALAAGVGYLVM